MISVRRSNAGAIFLILAVAAVSTWGQDMNSSGQPLHGIRNKRPTQTIPATPKIVKDEVIVKFHNAALPPKGSPERAATLRKKAEDLAGKYGLIHLRIYPNVGSLRMKVPAGMTVVGVIEKLKQDPQADKDIQLVKPNRITAHILRLEPPTAETTPPDDPEWLNGESWGMARIGMKKTWRMTNVKVPILVAVIDTGVDYWHPDFRHSAVKNIWTNPADGSHGVNYCPNDLAGNDPDDDNGHGTMVAGIIAAVGNNTNDIAGAYWYTKIMAVKSFCYDGAPESHDAVAEGIYFAVDNGATIINSSWSLDGYDDAEVRGAVQYANQRNVLFVAAAGNSNLGMPDYPARYTFPNVMAVAASNCTDQRWVESASEGSNYGATTVHIAAPGHEITSTWPDYFDGPPTAVLSGTSMAAAHVAGCAAVLQARNGPAAILPKDLIDMLKNGGDPVGLPVIGGRRLNCWNTLVNANFSPVANAGPDQGGKIIGSTVTINGGASSDANGDSLTYSWMLLSKPAGSVAVLSNPTSFSPTFTVDRAGNYTVQLIVNDGLVSSLPDNVIIDVPNSVTDTGAPSAPSNLTVR